MRLDEFEDDVYKRLGKTKEELNEAIPLVGLAARVGMGVAKKAIGGIAKKAASSGIKNVAKNVAKKAAKSIVTKKALGNISKQPSTQKSTILPKSTSSIPTTKPTKPTTSINPTSSTNTNSNSPNISNNSNLSKTSSSPLAQKAQANATDAILKTIGKRLPDGTEVDDKYGEKDEIGLVSKDKKTINIMKRDELASYFQN